jgi:hypothetical protein
MKVSNSNPREQEALSFFKDKGDVDFTILDVEDVISTKPVDIKSAERKVFLSYNVDDEQYIRLLKIRQILSAVIIALVLFWMLRIVFKEFIPLKEDLVRVTVVNFIGMLVPTVIATHVYDFLYFSGREQNQE